MSRLNRSVLMLAVGIAFGCAGDAPPDTTSTTRSLLAQPRPEDMATQFDATGLPVSEPELGIESLGMNLGSVDAPVKVIEFVDYGCGFCRQFQAETFAAIRREFIETNMVEWKFLPFVTGMFGNSAVVTEASECALDQDGRLFALVSERLWADQREWKGSDEPLALVRGWLTQAGGDGSAFDTCMDDDRRMPRVTSATALAAQLGVRATPTFWVIGVGPIQGALPIDAFREIFAQLHEQMTQSAG